MTQNGAVLPLAEYDAEHPPLFEHEYGEEADGVVPDEVELVSAEVAWAEHGAWRHVAAVVSEEGQQPTV